MITDLLEHQEKAVEKLSHVKVGALYMEMGTGKTRTALELCYNRIKKGKVEHIIWLCPFNCKETLKDEFEKHLGVREPKEITVCGIQTLSTSIKYNARLLKLTQDNKCFIVIDESNMIKNGKAKRTQNITRIAENCEYRLLLNGTPVTRNEADLFSQWYLLDWRILGYKGFYAFSANHLEYDDVTHRVRNVLNVDYLVQKIAPYCYQVKKSECLSLPDKTYETIHFDLTNDQKDHYYYVSECLLNELDQDRQNSALIYRLFTAMQLITSGYEVTTGKHMTKKLFFDDCNINPRIELLKDIIYNILGNKCIIFCEFNDEIKIICDLINYEYGKETAVIFNGECNKRERLEAINKFKTTSSFLITNKDCSAYGLNLQFCSYAIYYNNDWDYGTRQQSEDRIHRIGQENNVHIIDICARNTLDERILRCLINKENLVEKFKNELKTSNDIRNFIYCKGGADNA